MKELYKFKNNEGKIHELLTRLVGEGAAAFFHDACALMSEDTSIKSRSHLIGHCLREIESALRDVMLPEGWEGTVEKNKSDEKTKKNDIESNKENHKPEVEACIKLYELNGRSADFWLKLTKKGFSFASLAHRRALLGPRPINAIDWGETQDWLYYILKKIEGKIPGRFFSTMDTILQSKTPKTSVQTLKSKVALSHVNLRYFFEKLQDPTWLETLYKQGFFDTPEPPRIHEDGGLSYPSWPVMTYLKNIVSQESEKVGKICLKIETNNPSIQSDLLAIAIQLPIDYVVKIAVKAQVWLESDSNIGFIHIDREIGNLITHLGANNKIKEALILAKSSLTIIPDPKPPKEIDGISLGLKPVSKLSEWEYGKVIKEKILPLNTKCTTELIELFAEILNGYSFLSQKKKEQSSEDYSYIWRPAIEDHTQNRGRHDVRNILIEALRDSCEYAIKQGVDTKTVLAILNKYAYTIFLRMKLHILRLFPYKQQETIEKELTSKANLNKSSIRHEYYKLAQDQGKNISKNNKEKILKLATKGPDVKSYVEYRKKNKFPVDEKIIEGYVLGWQMEFLAPFSQASQELKTLYETLKKKAGRSPENPDFSVSHSSEGGSFSPKSPVESKSLLAKSLEEIVSYLKAWKPAKEEDYFDSSIRGLSDVLKEITVYRAEEFSLNALVFSGQDPSYIRGILGGLQEAVKQGKSINWPQTLELALWSVQQKRDNLKGKRHFLTADPSWDWCIKTAVDLIETGMHQEGPSALPFSLREKAWKILTTITHTPDPVLEEQEKIDKNLDALSLSINSTRGEAMHAVVRYSIWVWNRSSKQKRKALEKLMPEFFQELEYHLDPTNNQSPTLRSVYGQWLPWLADLNPKWVGVNLKRLFPENIKLNKLYQATWEAYVIYANQLSTTSYSILKPIYLEVANNMGYFVQKPRSYYSTPDERLGQHLSLFYLLGLIDLGEKDQLIETFFNKADEASFGAAIDFIGQELEKRNDPTVVKRAVKLWEWLITTFAKQFNNASSPQFTGFGWWFSSGALDTQWSLGKLGFLAQHGVKIDHDHSVIEHMETTVKQHPEETMGVLNYLVENLDNGMISYLDINIENIIKEAHARGDKSTILAKEISNKLVSRGHHLFRKYT